MSVGLHIYPIVALHTHLCSASFVLEKHLVFNLSAPKAFLMKEKEKNQ